MESHQLLLAKHIAGGRVHRKHSIMLGIVASIAMKMVILIFTREHTAQAQGLCRVRHKSNQQIFAGPTTPSSVCKGLHSPHDLFLTFH